MLHPSPAPSTELTVNTDVSASEDLFGKTIDDLQTGVTIGEDSITGTLKFVDDYTGFSSDPAMQSGNYLVIHCEVNDSTPITVEVVNGTSGPRQLDADGIIVLRIANKDTQSVRVVAGTVTKTYSLTGLTCLSEGAVQYLASDEIAQSAYGANLDKTYRFKSIYGDLEPFLLEKTNNSPDNLTKYLVEWKGNKYAVVKVTPLYIDIQWR